MLNFHKINLNPTRIIYLIYYSILHLSSQYLQQQFNFLYLNLNLFPFSTYFFKLNSSYEGEKPEFNFLLHYLKSLLDFYNFKIILIIIHKFITRSQNILMLFLLILLFNLIFILFIHDY